MKEKLVMFDMDGTLYDTVGSNYYAYKEALEQCGYTLDLEFFENVCFGHNYKTFVPLIIKENLKGEYTGKELDAQVKERVTEELLEKIHETKKNAYEKYFDEIRVNEGLINLIKRIKYNTNVALVTTASKKNVYDILEHFHHVELFDYIFTQEDVKEQKPDPTCYIVAMEHFKVKPEESYIYEDSDVGLKAAYKSGANVIKVGKF
ncbi:MAG: HAD family phosphatase [Eubacterium sp.]|nr:HAD family phosphatase [Eubacterium sp.]